MIPAGESMSRSDSNDVDVSDSDEDEKSPAKEGGTKDESIIRT